MQISEIFREKWFIELGLSIYFILKRNRFLTIAIFTGSASTAHNLLEIVF